MNSDKENKALQIPTEKMREARAVNIAESTQTASNQKSPIISFSKKKKRFRFSLRRLIMPTISLFLAFLLLSSY